MDAADPFAPTPRNLLGEELLGAWSFFVRLHEDETPYAFGLLLADGGRRLGVVVCTEEGLARAPGAGRWQVEASPHAAAGAGWLPRSQALRDAGAGDAGEAFHAAGIAALQRLDAAGAFGRGAIRRRLLLNVWRQGEAPAAARATAARLNPPEVLARLDLP